MNDLISWFRPILDEEESRAERMEHATDSSEAYSCPATRDYPLGDLPYGEANCTCNLAARKARALRQVQAHRAILELHRPDGQRENWFWQQRRCAECGKLWHKWTPNRPPTEIGPEVGCPTVRALVSIYSDRDGYGTEWSA